MNNVGPSRRLAVVLFNLGGPDSLKAVRPFLFNLFSDPAILSMPALLRLPLAALITAGRGKSAEANYARMGGASPLGPGTEAQRAALAERLGAVLPDREIGVFTAMRYWRPRSAETAAAVERFAPDDVVLLPLYPQYSTTTTASSLKAWRKAYRGPGVLREICCYPDLDALAEAHAQAIRTTWQAAGSPQPIQLLFSAHGLPEKVVTGGDPYEAQVQASAAAVMQRLGADWDWTICYQSRVGPLKWLGPSTLEAIDAAAAARRGVLVCPIAFVSEHIETLVELDHDYAVHARAVGCPVYLRAPALGVADRFIDGLAELVQTTLDRPPGLRPGGAWRCGRDWRGCPACRDAA